MSRKIIVASTRTNEKSEIESSANTWGQLKSDLSRNHIPYDSCTAILRANRATLEMDDAILPEGEFVLFLIPKKVKSGAKAKPVTDKDVEKMKLTAKKAGISLKIKLAKSDPKYNEHVKTVFDKAMAIEEAEKVIAKPSKTKAKVVETKPATKKDVKKEAPKVVAKGSAKATAKPTPKAEAKKAIANVVESVKESKKTAEKEVDYLAEARKIFPRY